MQSRLTGICNSIGFIAPVPIKTLVALSMSANQHKYIASLDECPENLHPLVKKILDHLEVLAEKKPLLLANFLKDKGELWFGKDLAFYSSAHYLSKRFYDPILEDAPCKEFAVLFTPDGIVINTPAHELAHHIDMIGSEGPCRFSDSVLFRKIMKWDAMVNQQGVAIAISAEQTLRKYNTSRHEETFAILMEMAVTRELPPLLKAFMSLVDLDLEYQSRFANNFLERDDPISRATNRNIEEILTKKTLDISVNLGIVEAQLANASTATSLSVFGQHKQKLLEELEVSVAEEVTAYALNLRHELLGEEKSHIHLTENNFRGRAVAAV